MKTEDIIEGLNKFIEDKRNVLKIKTSGHCILQKIIKANKTFKAYKEYEYILWFVQNNKKCKIITIRNVDRVLEGQEEEIIRRMNIELSKEILNWIGTNSYEKIIKGECNEYIG